DHDRWGRRHVTLIDFPPEKHRNLHSREESGPGVENPCLPGDRLPGDADLQPSTGAEEGRVRKRRVPDTWNRGASLAQLFIERENYRGTGAPPRRVSHEKNHLFHTKKPIWNELKIKKRRKKPPRRYQHQQRNDDLRNHECLAQAHPPEGPARPPTQSGRR